METTIKSVLIILFIIVCVALAFRGQDINERAHTQLIITHTYGDSNE